MPVAFCICEKETEAECYGAVNKAGVQAGAMITLVLKAKTADGFIYFIFFRCCLTARVSADASQCKSQVLAKSFAKWLSAEIVPRCRRKWSHQLLGEPHTAATAAVGFTSAAAAGGWLHAHL